MGMHGAAKLNINMDTRSACDAAEKAPATSTTTKVANGIQQAKEGVVQAFQVAGSNKQKSLPQTRWHSVSFQAEEQDVNFGECNAVPTLQESFSGMPGTKHTKVPEFEASAKELTNKEPSNSSNGDDVQVPEDPALLEQVPSTPGNMNDVQVVHPVLPSHSQDDATLNPTSEDISIAPSIVNPISAAVAPIQKEAEASQAMPAQNGAVPPEPKNVRKGRPKSAPHDTANRAVWYTSSPPTVHEVEVDEEENKKETEVQQLLPRPYSGVRSRSMSFEEVPSNRVAFVPNDSMQGVPVWPVVVSPRYCHSVPPDNEPMPRVTPHYGGRPQPATHHVYHHQLVNRGHNHAYHSHMHNHLLRSDPGGVREVPPPWNRTGMWIGHHDLRDPRSWDVYQCMYPPNQPDFLE
jgi:hypothetical protein